MTAPFLVGTATTASGSGAGSIAWPTGHAANDIAFVFVETDSNDASLSLSGWTAVTGSPLFVTGTNLGTGQDSKFSVFYKVASSSAEAAATWSDPGDHWVAAMVCVRGVDVADPFAFNTNGDSGAGPGTTVSLPSFTSAGADNLVLLGISNTDDNAGPYTVTNFGDSGSVTYPAYIPAADGNDGSVAVVAATIATSGTTFGSASYTLGGSRGGPSRNGEGFFIIGIKAPAISPIVGDSSFSMTTGNPVLTGAGALLASAALAMTPAATLGGVGALQGSTSFGFGHGTSYLFGTHAAEGSANLVTLGVPDATLGGLGQMVGSAGLSLDTTATGDTFEGSSAQSSLQLTTSGVLTGAGVLSGNAQANFNWNATLAAIATAPGNTTLELDVAPATLVGAGALMGSASLGLTPAGTLTGAAPMTATPLSLTISQYGDLLGKAALGGNTGLVWGQSGAITGAGQLQGSAPFSFTLLGNVGGESYISGAAGFTLDGTAQLRGAGRLIGTTNGLFTLMGTGNGYVDMAGNVSITMVPLGTLTAVFNPIFGQTFRDKWAAVFDAKQALLNAAAAQARGLDDEIIDTYFDAGMPYDGAIADLWRETSTSTLYRWDGSVWVAESVLAEGTADDALTIALAEPANVAAIADGRIRSYWRSEPPAIGVGGASEGDVWFDTDDGTAQLIWDGTGWVGTAAGANVYAQDDEPTGTIRVGDIWIDTNDGNKMRRWDGDAWVDVTDTRVSAAAAAVAELLSRVSATEDTLESQALSITNLSSQLSDTQGELDALATANETLETQVTSIAGSKATVFAQATTPSTSGRVNGDLWIDTDDGNRMYVWDGAWTLRADTNGLKIFAQTTAPSSVGRQVGDLWFDTDDNNRQYRWDGSAWLDVTDQRIISQASQITTLQSQVALLPAVYVQDTPPPGSTYAVGDIWFDSDDGNKQYIWNGTIWDDTSTISGAVTYAQTAEPTGGAYNIGDLWIDLDDGNRLYRWNGAAWIDVSDQRMVGQASAISALTTRVEATEGAITSQAGQITTLNSAVAAKTRTFVQASAPTATAIGDVWIDSDDNNKLYAWDGTSWVLRRLEAGASTYAQNAPPATGNLGDLWVDLDDSNKLYRWNGTSWILVTDGRIASQGTAISNLETRTSTAEGTIATHTGQITSLNASLATKPRIYADPAQPTGAVVGDLWIDTDDSNKLYTWNGSGWIYRPIPTGAKVYRQPTAPGTGVTGDLWFDSDDGNKPYIWSGSAWVDNTDARTAANASAVSALNASVAQKTKTFVQATTPPTTERVVGDLWIDTGNGNLLKAWNGAAWVAHADSNKIKTYAQSSAPTGGVYAVGDLWIDSDDNNLLYRWNGSNWVSVADVRISAQASQITALTAEVAGKATVSALNSLTTRVLTIEAEYGVNLLLNPGLVVDDRNWVADIWNSAGRPEWSHGRDLLGPGYQVAGTHNFSVVFAGTTPNDGEYYAVTGDKFPLEAGVTYGFQALLSMANVDSLIVAIVGYNSVGAPLGDMVALYNDQTGYSGGTSRAAWRPMSTQFTTFAGTAYGAFRIRPRTKAGGVNPRAHVMEAMLEKMAPGQTTVSPFNFGSSAVWAEWNLMFNVNGHISGIQYAADGHTANFVVDADNFEVRATRANRFLSWENGHLWNKGTDYSVIVGQDMTPDEDVIMWIGPNPTSPEAALKEDAAMYIMENGSAVFRGTLQQSLIAGSALELGSTRIHTGGGRLAPFVVRDMVSVNGGLSYTSRTLTIEGFVGPSAGTGYDWKRFALQRMDVYLEVTGGLDAHDDHLSETAILEVSYDGGAWTHIHTVTCAASYKAAMVMSVRYTTIDTWSTCSFRVRTTQGRTLSLVLKVEVMNFNQSGNAAGSNSGMSGTPSEPPPPGGGGGGGGGGSYCLVADSTYLPEGGLLQNAHLGTQILCWDSNIEEPGFELHALRKKPFGYEESFLITTANGAVVAQSKSTPTPVRAGGLLRAQELLGQEVLTNINGVLAWSEVVSVEALGIRRVVKPDVGDRILFAGTTPSATIATHNIRDKDFEL